MSALLHHEDLDPATRVRLEMHALQTGKTERDLAAWILREMLHDDDLYNAPTAPSGGSVIPFRKPLKDHAMARRKKGDEGETQEPAPAPAKSADVTRLVPGDTLRSLMKAKRSAKRETDKINGAIGERLQKAKDDKHLRLDLFREMMRLDRMEGEELADYEAQREYYMEESGLTKRAADATGNLDFGAGEGADGKTEGEEPADKPRGGRRAANVAPFPTPTSVAAE